MMKVLEVIDNLNSYVQGKPVAKKYLFLSARSDYLSWESPFGLIATAVMFRG